MIKKSVLVVFAFLVLASFVFAQSDKIQITPSQDSFQPGQNVTFQVALYDPNNNLIPGQINVSLQDADKRTDIEATVPANQQVSINLGTNAYFGYWTITADYQNSDGSKTEASALIMVEQNQQVDFQIVNDTLIITNTGNTRYTQTIQIVIGDTVGTKDVDLDIGRIYSIQIISS